LPGIFHALDLLRGNVGRELDDPDGLALGVEHRVVGGLNPDFAPALAKPLVLCRLVFATVEPRPELAIGHAVALGRVNEHAVMFALNFIEGVAHGFGAARLAAIPVGVSPTNRGVQSLL
jgi:hypothetical protein